MKEWNDFAGYLNFKYNSGLHPTCQRGDNSAISGEVAVTFTIDKDGVVKNPQIERSVHPLLDKEGLRVVNLLGT